ncbi:glycosyltransferase family 2 protein [Candidatus Dependentiae bacterium]|nr:glycosyltransferase family 2 protein [Candidatus Dependentiae bacterium]
MKVTVIIPAYRRPVDLERCLNALKRQKVQPEEIIVTVRDFDEECQTVVKQYSGLISNLQLVIVTGVGQIHAWKKGFEHSTGEIISFLDDDSEPLEDWIEQIIKHFAKSNCAGVSGYTPNIDENGKEIYIRGKVVGKLFWYGKFLGNFHEYYPKVIKIDSLRGANMTFRRKFIESNFKFKLKGREYKNDTALSFEVVKRGGYLEYNPLIKVRHHIGRQFINKGREPSNEEQYANSYNNTLIILKYKSYLTFFTYLFFSILVGQNDAPGVLRMLKAIADGWFIYVGFFVYSFFAKFIAVYNYAFNDIRKDD